MRRNLRSLSNRNYRLWAAGASLSYAGTWMQRTAQTWLVLAELTDNDASALGMLTGLQFAPLVLLLPWSGVAADRFDRRRLLIITQCAQGLLAAALGILTISGAVALWHVYMLAFAFGCATAFDSPASQSFAAELVGDDDLSNAVALNAAAFNAARLVGPAIAGVLIAAAGTGWVFLINAGSFMAVILALAAIRARELHKVQDEGFGGMGEGIAYVRSHRRLRTALLALFLVGTFALHFPLLISAMAVKVFHVGPGRFGLLMSIMAVGSVGGAIAAAGVQRTLLWHLMMGSALLAGGYACAALAPDYWWFAAALTVIGLAAVTFTTSTSSFMQLESDRAMRGRVMALRVAVATGATPLGAPLLGLVAEHWGARWVLVTAALASLLAAVAIARELRLGRQP